MSKAKKTPPRRNLGPRPKKLSLNYYSRGTGRPTSSPFVSEPGGRNYHQVGYQILNWLILAGVLVGLGYSLIVNPAPTIVANQYSLHSRENYRDTAIHYLKSLRNRNKITFDQEGLSNYLVKTYPEIVSISVELPVVGQKPVIRLHVAEAAVILQKEQAKYVIDSNGISTGVAGSLTEAQHLPLVVDESSYQVKAGKRILSVADIAFIKAVQAQCQRAGVSLASMSLPAVPEELDIKASGDSYKVKFYLGGEPNLQVGQFLAAHNKFKAGGGPSQYLDVRVAGKVYYK